MISISPEFIISVVKQHVSQERNIRFLSQYIIRQKIRWLPLSRIAEVTGSTCHSSVIDSIKKIKADPDLTKLAHDIMAEIQSKLDKEHNPRGHQVNG